MVTMTGLSQHARLITLTSAQQSGLPESLVVERFTGHEAVNLDCLPIAVSSYRIAIKLGQPLAR